MFFIIILIIDLYFLITAFIAQIFISTAELAIPTGIPIKTAKSEMETYPVTLEAKINFIVLGTNQFVLLHFFNEIFFCFVYTF